MAQVVPARDAIKDKAYRRAIQQAERFIDSLRIRQDIPGISVAVGTHDKLLWAEGFGYADVETKLPVTVLSRFRLGSVSKSVTSLAVGKLVEEGKLDLDAPVQRYVPDFPQKKYPITSRQLATHTAGIRHYRDDDPLNCLRRYKTVTEGLTIFNKDSLLFQPGTAYTYSTYGYNLLSAAIEGASHIDFLTYLQAAVFNPLAMSHTSPDYSDSIVVGRVRFYEHSQGHLVNANQVDNSYKWAGGGLLSTPSDLVRLGRELIQPKVLTKETVALLFTPQLLLDGKNTNYGLGWRIGTDSKGRKICHHGGTIDGGRAFLLIFPDDDLVVAIAANMSGVTINLPELERLANYFHGSAHTRSATGN
ncbi:serine hydrolase domain-containing protein [Spirosoma agri]